MGERLCVLDVDALDKQEQLSFLLADLSNILTYSKYHPNTFVNTNFRHPYLDRLINYPIFEVKAGDEILRFAIPNREVLHQPRQFDVTGFIATVRKCVEPEIQTEIDDGDILMLAHLECTPTYDPEIAAYVTRIRGNKTANAIVFLNIMARERWAHGLDHEYLSKIVAPDYYEEIHIGHGKSQGLSQLTIEGFRLIQYDTQNPA